MSTFPPETRCLIIGWTPNQMHSIRGPSFPSSTRSVTTARAPSDTSNRTHTLDLFCGVVDGYEVRMRKPGMLRHGHDEKL
eukprot:scaffold30122_cov114-Cyclotella_meneghiniana.AAC.1